MIWVSEGGDEPSNSKKNAGNYFTVPWSRVFFQNLGEEQCSR